MIIYQGLFNILYLYFEEIDEFFNQIDVYFYEKINDFLQKRNLFELTYTRIHEEIVNIIKDELVKIGFKQDKIGTYFNGQSIEKKKENFDEITSIFEIYSQEFAPIVYEIFLEEIIDYLVETKAALIILNMKYKGLFPTEFILELRNLKQLFQNAPKKVGNLRKYIHIQEKIIQKFRENKKKIEFLEDLENPRDKLQLIYSIFRIIDFFHIEKIDFSHIITYLKENIDEWLTSYPLITLKNPDIYFCGIYLSKHLNAEIEIKKLKDFLQNQYEECIDEFEAPLFEATDRVYYFLKSTEMVKYWLDDEAVGKIIKTHPRVLETNFFKDFETSQLVVILKIYNLLKVYQRIDPRIIQAILDELELRITPEGIKQYRDGIVTSESIYYLLFVYYMRNVLEKLKDYELLDSIVSRIYRNLEFLEFSQDTNFDLVSELFYSCESLKLFNCIETKEMIIHLTKFLFPKIELDKIKNTEGITHASPRIRHFKVNRLTGETIY